MPILLAVAGCSAEGAREVENANTTGAIVTALSWLPPDTEVVVALS